MGSMRRLQRVWEGADSVCVGEAGARCGEGQWRGHVRGVVEGMGAIHPYAPPSRTYMSVFKLAATLVGPIVILYLVVSVSRRSPQP